MTTIRFAMRSAIVATSLMLGATGIARAESAPMADPDFAVANSGEPCVGDFLACGDEADRVALAHTLQAHKQIVHHRYAKRRSPSVAAHQGVGLEQVAFQQLVNGPACTGANAWSLLCPGAQLIGISY
jgi:hypothetical protein